MDELEQSANSYYRTYLERSLGTTVKSNTEFDLWDSAGAEVTNLRCRVGADSTLETAQC